MYGRRTEGACHARRNLPDPPGGPEPRDPRQWIDHAVERHALRPDHPAQVLNPNTSPRISPNEAALARPRWLIRATRASPGAVRSRVVRLGDHHDALFFGSGRDASFGAHPIVDGLHAGG